ncbi:MAG: ribonuclease J [Candidatus Paceibacteria bacterium]
MTLREKQDIKAKTAKSSSGLAIAKPNEIKPLRVIPLGGLEEVGRNMTLLEYERNILIIDMGLRFPEEDMPGIDYIIPNIEYLKDKRDWIRGIFITHGHYDHIGAIPYIVDKIGYPTIYTTPLSKGIILKRQEDFPRMRKLHIETIDKDNPKTIELGPFRVDPFHVNHNIPDSIGLAIQTPVGQVIHTCDFKFDFNPVADKPADLGRIVNLASRGTLLLLSDSTGAENPGHSISEQVIMENLEKIFEEAKGRIIVSTFASLIGRIQQIIWLAEKFDRKVAPDGHSMRSNITISRALGYISHKKHTLILPEEAIKLPDERVVILCTGAQGEPDAALMRIANKEHRYFKIQPGDTVIFSSSIVPGNERAVQNLKDSLYRQGAKVYHYKMMDIHASGHAYADDLRLMLNLVRPKFLIPIHGQYFMLRAHADIAESLGIPKENIVVASNGSVVEVTPERIKLTPQRVPANYVMVDGLGVGDIGEVVLRDRQMMAQDGMVVVIAVIDSERSRLRQDPDVISRGFVYMRESKELVGEIKRKVRYIVEKHIAGRRDVNDSYIKNSLRDELGEFLFQKTQRRPMILPVLISV